MISDDEEDEDLDDLYALPNKKPAPHSPKGKKAAVSPPCSELFSLLHQADVCALFPCTAEAQGQVEGDRDRLGGG